MELKRRVMEEGFLKLNVITGKGEYDENNDG